MRRDPENSETAGEMTDLDRNVLYDDVRVALDETSLVIRWHSLSGVADPGGYTWEITQELPRSSYSSALGCATELGNVT